MFVWPEVSQKKTFVKNFLPTEYNEAMYFLAGSGVYVAGRMKVLEVETLKLSFYSTT